MPTTPCVEARGAVAVYARPQDLPPAAQALFARAGSNLFDSIAWYDTVLAAGLPDGAEPRFLLCEGVLVMPMQVVGRRFVSLTTPYTCRYQPLCDPAAEEAARHRAFTAFARYCRAWPTVRLDALDSDAPWLAALSAGAAAADLIARPFDHFGNWHEEVGGQGWDGYLAARPGALRATIRRRLARATRAGGRFDLVTGGAALEPGIAAYETVYARSWKPAEPFPLFNAALMRALAARGLLRLGLYWLADRPVAAQLWVLEAGTATVLKLAHDEAAQADSPGTVLTALMLRHLLDAEGATAIDFGRGDDAYKRGWARARRQRRGIVLADPRDPRGLAFLARHALGRLRRAGGG